MTPQEYIRKYAMNKWKEFETATCNRANGIKGDNMSKITKKKTQQEKIVEDIKKLQARRDLLLERAQLIAEIDALESELPSEFRGEE